MADYTVIRIPQLTEGNNAQPGWYFAIYNPSTNETLRIDVSEFLNTVSTGSYDWVNTNLYNTDEVVFYSNKLWASKVDNNQGNTPQPGAYWEEITQSVSSGLKTWAAGAYVDDDVFVVYDDGGGNQIYQLNNATRPFNSTDIDAEILNGDWVPFADVTVTVVPLSASQVAHGFATGTVIGNTGGNFTIAANKPIGVVSTVVDPDNFEYVTNGLIQGLAGLTPGQLYYSDNAGSITDKPTRYAVMLAISATEAIVNISEGKSRITKYSDAGDAVHAINNNQIEFGSYNHILVDNQSATPAHKTTLTLPADPKIGFWLLVTCSAQSLRNTLIDGNGKNINSSPDLSLSSGQTAILFFTTEWELMLKTTDASFDYVKKGSENPNSTAFGYDENFKAGLGFGVSGTDISAQIAGEKAGVKTIGITVDEEGRTGVGNTDPDDLSILDIQSTDKGLLIPRLTTAQRTTLGGLLGAGQKGMIVYDTDIPQLYTWSGAAWTSPGGGDVLKSGTPIAGQVAIWLDDETIQGLASLFFDTVNLALGIGTNTPDQYSALDLTATDKGLLKPRLTTAQRTSLGSSLGASQDALEVYDTDEKKTYSWDGTQWVAVGSGASVSLEERVMFNGNLDTVRDIYFYNTLTFGNFFFDSLQIANLEFQTSTDAATWTSHGSISSPGSAPGALQTWIDANGSTSWYLRLIVTYQSGEDAETGVQTTYTR